MRETWRHADILDLTNLTPKIPNMRSSDEADLSKATIAVIDKAFYTLISKFSSKGGSQCGCDDDKKNNKSPPKPLLT
eukprot:15240421-Ditylum_brightwellii.AAC.1